jgi:hypothetical protein
MPPLFCIFMLFAFMNGILLKVSFYNLYTKNIFGFQSD